MKDLEDLASRFPGLAKTGSLGESVVGNDLRFILISNNVNKRTTLEPMVKLIGKNDSEGQQQPSIGEIFPRKHARWRDCGEAAAALPRPLPPQPVWQVRRDLTTLKLASITRSFRSKKVKFLVDNMELYIVPTMNPDGFAIVEFDEANVNKCRHTYEFDHL